MFGSGIIPLELGICAGHLDWKTTNLPGLFIRIACGLTEYACKEDPTQIIPVTTISLLYLGLSSPGRRILTRSAWILKQQAEFWAVASKTSSIVPKIGQNLQHVIPCWNRNFILILWRPLTSNHTAEFMWCLKLNLNAYDCNIETNYWCSLLWSEEWSYQEHTHWLKQYLSVVISLVLRNRSISEFWKTANFFYEGLSAVGNNVDLPSSLPMTTMTQFNTLVLDVGKFSCPTLVSSTTRDHIRQYDTSNSKNECEWL